MCQQIIVAMAESTFSQTGTIEHIGDDAITVRIDCNSACSACHSKDVCLSTDKAVKHITIEPDGRVFAVGQQVTVYGQKQLATKALFWGYIAPLLLVIAVLAGMILAGFAEAVAGLTALLALAPYYLALFLLRDRFKRTFIFKIK